MELVWGWQVLFYGSFFLASLFDLKTKRIPSIVVAPNLFAFAVICYLQAPMYAVGFLAIFSAIWFLVAFVSYFTKKVALNFIDILYLALALTITKNVLVFLVIFTLLGYLFWLKYGKKEAPLLPPLFIALGISLI